MLVLVLGEAVVIAGLGGLGGVFLGRLIYAALHEIAPQLVQIDHMPWSVIFAGVAVAQYLRHTEDCLVARDAFRELFVDDPLPRLRRVDIDRIRASRSA